MRRLFRGGIQCLGMVKLSINNSISMFKHNRFPIEIILIAKFTALGPHVTWFSQWKLFHLDRPFNAFL